MRNSQVTPKKQKGPVGARLFVIFARRSHVAVIFRRGPSKWVQLIKWNTDNDTFEPGQWFHGRIYEKRCDLSPDGSLLVYFAQKISARTLKDKEYTLAWTAISKPPYLTALALWPKGDCWNGGGLFHSNKALALYHTPATDAHPEHKPPRWLHVTFTDRGRGEDDPIFSDRLERDGWKLEQEWTVENHWYPKWYHTEQPEIRQKFNRNRKFAVQLIRAINRLDYTEEFFALTDKGTCVAPIKKASWADWDQNGRLVFCRDGRVYAASLSVAGDWKEVELANLNSSKPVPLPAPRSATIW